MRSAPMTMTRYRPIRIKEGFAPMEKRMFEDMKTFSQNNFVRKRIWQTDKLHCNMYCFEPGQQNSPHRHLVSDEVVLCLEGEGIIVVGTEQQPIKVGETVLVPINTPHGYINTLMITA